MTNYTMIVEYLARAINRPLRHLLAARRLDRSGRSGRLAGLLDWTARNLLDNPQGRPLWEQIADARINADACACTSTCRRGVEPMSACVSMIATDKPVFTKPCLDCPLGHVPGQTTWHAEADGCLRRDMCRRERLERRRT